MALVTDTVAKVNQRLMLSGTAVAAEPGSAEVEDYVREAYAEVFSQLDLPRLTTGEVAESGDFYVSTLAGCTTCYVLGMHQRALIPSVEYIFAPPTVHLVPGIAIAEDELWAWVKPEIDFTGADIDTSCAHGTDWLEPPVVWLAEMYSLSRMSRPAGSTGAAQHGTHYVSLERGYMEMLKGMRQIHGAWMEMQAAAISTRLGVGDHPLFESAYATIRERGGGRKRNRVIGST